jgi:hypothetical protein
MITGQQIRTRAALNGGAAICDLAVMARRATAASWSLDTCHAAAVTVEVKFRNRV